ncbi:MAG: aminoglycoside phosphotransferase family protein [Alphaproteobacteria bacterium]
MRNNIVICLGNLNGKGVYANRDFKAGEIVIKYNLKPLSEEEYTKLPESEKSFTHKRLDQIYLYLEPERYVNHAINPNTHQDFVIQADIALCNIMKGEMITSNAMKDEVSSLVEFYKYSAGITVNPNKSFKPISNLTQYENNIFSIYGKHAGTKWLKYLPELISKISIKYNLSTLKPLNNLSYNYVLEGFQNYKPVIVKISIDIEAMKCEAAAIETFENYGGVKLLAEEKGLLILEKITPGNTLKSYFPNKDKEALQIVCNLIEKFHKVPLPQFNQFPNVKDWLRALDQDWDIPNYYLEKAKVLRDQLLSTADKEFLLHGDLHHDNILYDGSNWVVIDPKGIIGPAAYELGAFIRNPIPELLNNENVKDIIESRISSFSTILNMPYKNILYWCYMQNILAWIWALEDGNESEYFKELSVIFDSLSI